jgi:hypothetical protein
VVKVAEKVDQIEVTEALIMWMGQECMGNLPEVVAGVSKVAQAGDREEGRCLISLRTNQEGKR